METDKKRGGHQLLKAREGGRNHTRSGRSPRFDHGMLEKNECLGGSLGG